MLENKRRILMEFLRYVLVGGISFLVDAGVLALMKQMLFSDHCTAWQMALCVAVGFGAGLLVNYLLSSVFVFCSEDQKKQSKRVSSFLIYMAVGVIGLGITELGMWFGGMVLGNDGLWYMLVKCFMAGIVLVWNYLGRKIFVYHGQ